MCCSHLWLAYNKNKRRQSSDSIAPWLGEALVTKRAPKPRFEGGLTVHFLLLFEGVITKFLQKRRRACEQIDEFARLCTVGEGRTKRGAKQDRTALGLTA